MESFRCAIVGGGIHGVYMAGRILEETQITASELVVIDPNKKLLSTFRQRVSACGMETLRSPYVHHVGTDPFSLETYAEANHRGGELVETVHYPERPTQSLFFDHADNVISRSKLDKLHWTSKLENAQYVTNSSSESSVQLILETDDGSMMVDTCILAIGVGDQLTIPEWAANVEDIKHVWGEFNRSRRCERTIVVGGGITAGQLATTIAGRQIKNTGSETEHIQVLTKSPIEWETTEAPPPWLNWDHIERELHQYPPASQQRYNLICEVRNDGTMPPYLYDKIDSYRSDGILDLTEGDVVSARQEGDQVELRLACGDKITADRAVLATGFDSSFQIPLVDRLANSLNLERGYRGSPVLDDDTLGWHHHDKTDTPLYVTGALALCTVGPFASNIVGARRSADRIIPAIKQRLICKPS